MELYFMDIFEHLVMMMIIRREIINYALKTGHVELITSPETYVKHLNEIHIFASEDEEFGGTPKKKKSSPLNSLQASKVQDKTYSKDIMLSEESPFKGITLNKIPEENTNYMEEEHKDLGRKQTERNQNFYHHDMTGLFDNRVASNALTNFDNNGAKSGLHKKSSTINNTKSYENRLMRSVHYSGGFLKQDSMFTQGIEDSIPHNFEISQKAGIDDGLKRKQTMDPKLGKRSQESQFEGLELGKVKDLQLILDEDAAYQHIRDKHVLQNHRTMITKHFQSPFGVDGPYAADILNSPLGLDYGTGIIEEDSLGEEDDFDDEDQLDLDSISNQSEEEKEQPQNQVPQINDADLAAVEEELIKQRSMSVHQLQQAIAPKTNINKKDIKITNQVSLNKNGAQQKQALVVRGDNNNKYRK